MGVLTLPQDVLARYPAVHVTQVGDGRRVEKQRSEILKN